MKTNKTLNAIIVCLMITQVMIAQTITSKNTTVNDEMQFRKNVIKTNPLAPLGLIKSEYHLMYERGLTAKTSLIGGVSYIKTPFIMTLADQANGNDPYLSISGLKFQMGARFYLNKRKDCLEGFYLSPMVSLTSGRVAIKELYFTEAVNGSLINFKAQIGKQVISKSGFTVDLFSSMGVGSFMGVYTANYKSGFHKDYVESGSGMLPTFNLGFQIGYAF